MHLFDRLRALLRYRWVAVSVFVVVLLGIGCAGYLFRPLSWAKRMWAWAAAALLMMPPLPCLPATAADVAGLAVGAALVMWERRARVMGAALTGMRPSA